MSATVQNVFSSTVGPDRRSASTTPSLRARANYRADIDGLRALAIIPVVIFHAFPAIMPGGFVGVDIFFVISGFLISSILINALQGETFSFGHFYANRIKRIFPALLAVLTFCFVFGWFFLLPDEYIQLGKHIVGAASYVENFLLRREAGYFDIQSSLKPLMHLWSLGIEEQFYLTYPLFLWIVWRLRFNLFGLLLSLSLASFCLNVWEIHHDPVGAFFLPQTRCWELLAGGSIACWHLGRQHRLRHRVFSVPSPGISPLHISTPVIRNAASVLGFLLIVSALFLIHESDPFPGWRASIPVGGAALLIVGGPHSWVNRKILAARTMVFVGLISYSLYLWHWPVLTLPRILHGDELGVPLRLAGVLLSFGLAWATWRFIENPVRFVRNTWTKTATLLTLSVAIGAAGLAAYFRGGFISRFPNLPGDLGRSQEEAYFSPECGKTLGLSDIAYCRSTAPGPPDVLLIGDSHAGALYRGLAPEYRKRSQILMNLGEPGCVPFYDTESYTAGIPDTRCKPIVNSILDFAISNSSARTIILALRGPLNMLGQQFDSAGSKQSRKQIRWLGGPEGNNQAETFRAAFTNTVSRLYASGKTVILFIDWPELDFDPRSCLPRPVSFFSRPRMVCGVPRIRVDARNREYRELIEQLKRKFPRLKSFDPLPYLCDRDTCYAMSGGHLLYGDNNHLSAAGSSYLGKNFLKEELLSQTRPAENVRQAIGPQQ